jgi:hypothetical protein
LQPDAQEPATMDGQGAESGEAVVEVGIAHGGAHFTLRLERAVGGSMVSLETTAVALDPVRVSLVNVAAYDLAAPAQDFFRLSTSRLWLHPL